MSLDVYLRTENPRRSEGGSGIFVRRDGQTVEITREEWDAAFPGREPIIVEREESDALFSANVTHNLGAMAHEAGIYLALWRPAELDPERGARIRAQEKAGTYHGPGGAFEIERHAVIHARDLVVPLKAGLALMEAEPERFEKHNPENGWGSYRAFVPWVRNYLRACQENPDAVVQVSR